MADRRVNVKLTGDASQYMSTLAKAGAATEALDKKVEAASRRVETARRQEQAAADRVAVATLRLQEVRAKDKVSASQLESATRSLARAQSNLEAKTNDVASAMRHLDEAQDSVTASNSKFVTNISNAGDDAGKGFASRFGLSMRRQLLRDSPFIAAVVGGALTAGAPLALLGAAALFGGIGAIAGAQAVEVKRAWSALGQEIARGSLADAKEFIPALTGMADDLGESFERLRPQIRQAFEASAPLVETFTKGLTGFVEETMPGLVRVLERGQPMMRGFQTFMEKVGEGFTGFFDAMSEHSADAGAAFEAWGEVLGALLPLIGELVGQGAALAHTILPPLAGGLNTVLGVLELLDPILPTIVGGFLAMRAIRGLGAVLTGVGGGFATVAQNAAFATYAVGGFAGGAAAKASTAASRASRAFSSMGAMIGKAGAILPVLGVGLVVLSQQLEDSAQQEAAWADAITKGGREASDALKQYEESRNRLSGTPIGDWFQDVDEWLGLKASWEDSADAAEVLREKTIHLSAALTDVPGVVHSAADAIALVGDTSHMTKDQMEEAVQGVISWREEIQRIATDFVDPLETYKGLLQEKQDAEQEAAQGVADSTADSSDSWKDYVDDVDVSLGELAARLKQQLDEQMNWRTNLVEIAKWAGVDVANYLLKMGKDGVSIVADMKNGTTAEAQAMAEQIRRDIAFGGTQWAAELQFAGEVMDTIARQGARATAQSVADELGVGLVDIARVANNYGLTLAGGINPILRALAMPDVVITADMRRSNPYYANRADGAVVDYYAEGGTREKHVAQIARAGEWRVWAEPETGGEAYIPLSPAKRQRSIEIWRETGRRLGEGPQAFAWGGINDIPRPPSTDPYNYPISTAARGTMDRVYNDTVTWAKKHLAPPLRNGVGYQAMMSALRMHFPGLQLISGFRPGSITATGNLSYHALGRAVDVPPRWDVFEWLRSNYGAMTKELIFSPANGRQLWNGRPHMYSEPTRGDHWDHVHWAMAKGGILNPHVRDNGGPLLPGYTYNGTGAPERVVSREFSGGSTGGTTVRVAAPDLRGLSIQGRVDINADGIATIAGVVVDQRLGDIADAVHYAGV